MHKNSIIGKGSFDRACNTLVGELYVSRNIDKRGRVSLAPAGER